MEIFIFIILGFLVYVFVHNYFANKKIEQMKQDRAEGGNFRPENSSKTICSIPTGLPVQVRYGDGGLTGAGAQQIQWCKQMLIDIGKKKVLEVDGPFGKVKYTKKQIEDHLKSI